MGEDKVILIGKATLENIRKGVSVLKKAVKSGRKEKPSIVIFRDGELQVGLLGNSSNNKVVNVRGEDRLLVFTESTYEVMARRTENVLEISKVIKRNAEDKARSLDEHRIPYQEYDDLLYNIGEFLEDDNSLNVVYDKGVGSFDAYDFIHVEDMVESIRGELTNNKKIRGIQVRGIPQVQLYIQVKDYDEAMVSLSYLGDKDNVYDTVEWNGKDSLKAKVNHFIEESREYDRSLTVSKLDKDVGGYTPKTVAQKSVLDMSDEDFKEVLEDY